jgi:hypothetical protein
MLENHTSVIELGISVVILTVVSPSYNWIPAFAKKLGTISKLVVEV